MRRRATRPCHTGRPAVYCSKAHYQAASRAKQRAQITAGHAVRLRTSVNHDLQAAAEALAEVRRLLAEPLRLGEMTAERRRTGRSHRTPAGRDLCGSWRPRRPGTRASWPTVSASTPGPPRSMLGPVRLAGIRRALAPRPSRD
ncbi:hypothetical protein [Actinomadura sp. DC4]|uniref:hypothetical protein n=1 Tax=Actinomadura sp. DC4 TaxID=3055069 RepID=UPI0025B07E4A|nr:hypothetical protein [Actinomadura sp. DC4]MDN3352311.1 hypothetical protein [Actinomadura sp. DC4]